MIYFFNSLLSVSNLGVAPLKATALYVEESVVSIWEGDWKIWFLSIILAHNIQVILTFACFHSRNKNRSKMRWYLIKV